MNNVLKTALLSVSLLGGSALAGYAQTRPVVQFGPRFDVTKNPAPVIKTRFAGFEQDKEHNPVMRMVQGKDTIRIAMVNQDSEAPIYERSDMGFQTNKDKNLDFNKSDDLKATYTVSHKKAAAVNGMTTLYVDALVPTAQGNNARIDDYSAAQQAKQVAIDQQTQGNAALTYEVAVPEKALQNAFLQSKHNITQFEHGKTLPAIYVTKGLKR